MRCYVQLNMVSERRSDKPHIGHNDIYIAQCLFVKFEEMLEYIIENNGKWKIQHFNNEIIYKELYDNLFCKEKIVELV